MIEPRIAPTTPDAAEVLPRAASADVGAPARWEARRALARYRAETERLRVLIEFLGRPIHAHGGTDPDPDIVTAYNLAVEAALGEVRRAAMGPD